MEVKGEFIWAWMAESPEIGDSIIGMDDPKTGAKIPMLTSWGHLVELMRPIATEYGRRNKVTVKLVKFRSEGAVEVFPALAAMAN